MHTIDLSLSRKPSNYQILIGEGVISQPISLFETSQYNNIAIVSNEMVSTHYYEAFQESLTKSKFQGKVTKILIGDGESYKSFSTYSDIIENLLENGFRRNDLIVALGGGVVGDIAGFSAASYQRGMDFIQIPTSLLAMVDSSVGGKTAINHPLGKNMIGAFHQPVQVRIDTDCLKTLAKKEFSAGMAEIIKIAAIYDEEFFEWLETNSSAIKALEPVALEYMISRSCRLKAQIVEQDELEQGIRAILNFGHTFGHAIESVSGYGKLLHGEAVAIGMMLASYFKEEVERQGVKFSQRISQLLTVFNLPTELPQGLSVRELVSSMSKDKKNLNDKIRLILLERIGKVKIEEFEPKTLIEFLQRYE